MGSDDRLRQRQGPVRMRDGVPYADRDTTLSLLSGAALGEWLSRQSPYVRGRLLDLGAGNQPYAPWYAGKARSVVCMDAAAHPGVHVLGLAEGLPFADATFDTVLATEVLEHVEDAERSVAEIARVLRPGGHVIVTVPFLYPTHEAPYDFRRFTSYGLANVLERHGLEILTVDAKGGVSLLAAHAVVLTLRTVLETLGDSQRAPLIDRKPLRFLLWAPQEARIRWGPRFRTVGVGGSAGWVSLGYMAVARRPNRPLE